MAWVRYDDQLNLNPKVMATIAEDPGAMGLHLLANTWTNAQKHPGYIPPGIPGVLLCDRGLGEKWADILVQNDLWHERGKECEQCREEYADLPESKAGGYVIHNSKEYRAPARERQTPGTPADLSAVRRAAGSKGGRSTAVRREQNQQANQATEQTTQATGQQNPGLGGVGQGAAQDIDNRAPSAVVDAPLNADEPRRMTEPSKQNARANAASDATKASKGSSNSASPVPEPGPLFASDEANSPSGGDAASPPPDADEPKTEPAKRPNLVVACFLDAAKEAGHDPPTSTIIKRVGRDAKRLLDKENVPFDRLMLAAERMGTGNWQSLDVQLQRLSQERVGVGARASPGNNVYRNPVNQDDYDDWNRP
jgi:hypothetical protein